MDRDEKDIKKKDVKEDIIEDDDSKEVKDTKDEKGSDILNSKDPGFDKEKEMLRQQLAKTETEFAETKSRFDDLEKKFQGEIIKVKKEEEGEPYKKQIEEERTRRIEAEVIAENMAIENNLKSELSKLTFSDNIMQDLAYAYLRYNYAYKYDRDSDAVYFNGKGDKKSLKYEIKHSVIDIKKRFPFLFKNDIPTNPIQRQAGTREGGNSGFNSTMSDEEARRVFIDMYKTAKKN